MRLLFALTQHALLRHFESVVLELARRGHQITIVTQDRGEAIKLPASFERDANISHRVDELTRRDAHGELLRKTRAIRDYLRYRAPAFAGADKLRARALRKMIKTVSDDTRLHLAARTPEGRKVKDEALVTMMVEAIDGQPHGTALDRFLAQIEDAVPADVELTRYLQGERFDAVVVTPLVFMPSPQPELVKSARAAGIPSIFPVFSWDNLTTKGLVHVLPDAVTVWNDRQRDELVELHGVPAERVVVTGAARFDGFIERQASEDRAAFCTRHRLDPEQPLIAYVASSEFVSAREPDFVVEWLARVRADQRLARAGVVIRPHPRLRDVWESFDAARWPHVTVAHPRAADSDQTLRDLLEHAAVVVGLNTSAELEAGIAGKPVLTVIAGDHATGQDSTLHFHYLLEEGGGFVKLARSLDEHVEQLAATLGGAVDRGRIRDFMQRFVRPAGWERPVTPLVADAVERVAHGKLNS